ncbi:MAG TPA: DoxX family protein [Polyangiaceae bacterium]|nr:DoxX family protein [Polyangiaceae bacterium]
MTRTTLRTVDRFAHSHAQYAPTLLRLGLGAVFLAHAYAKLTIFTLPGTRAFFEAHGFPGWSAYPVFALELIGGVSLLLGLYSRVAALALIPVMLGALVPHLANGWMFTNSGGGWEYVAFLLIALFTQLLLGDGAFALSHGRAAEKGTNWESPSVRAAS